MDALDRALDEALKRRRACVGTPAQAAAQPPAAAAAGAVQCEAVGADVAGSVPARPAPAAARAKSAAVDPWSPEAVLRAANEDDDLYDPYSDYMDALARSSFEEPCEDPWR